MSELENLDWKGLSPFYFDNLVKKKEKADGSCFFHCIADAFYILYQSGKVNKTEFVKKLRKELSLLLESKNDQNVVWYQSLSRGALNEFSKTVPGFSLEGMKKQLDSSEYVDNRYNEFVSNVFNKDIYILDQSAKNVYKVGKDEDILYKNRSSIVIIWCNGNHYDLVGVVEDNKLRTLFPYNHPLIEKIRLFLK
jgi:hypothetical protein